jgi:hypothetical protein
MRLPEKSGAIAVILIGCSFRPHGLTPFDAAPGVTAFDAALGDSTPLAAIIDFAAVAFGHGSAVASLSYALTIPTGTARVLIVSVEIGSNCTVAVPSVSDVTYAAVGLTRITSIAGTPCGPMTTRSEQWILVAPAMGTNQVLVTTAAAVPSSIHSAAMAFAGVDQTSPVRAFASASGAATSSSITVPSAVGDMVVSTVGQGTSITAQGPGQTLRFLDNVSSSNTLDNAAGSTAPGGSPSTTMTWTFGGSDEWQTIACSMQPAMTSH